MSKIYKRISLNETLFGFIPMHYIEYNGVEESPGAFNKKHGGSTFSSPATCRPAEVSLSKQRYFLIGCILIVILTRHLIFYHPSELFI